PSSPARYGTRPATLITSARVGPVTSGPVPVAKRPVVCCPHADKAFLGKDLQNSPHQPPRGAAPRLTLFTWARGATMRIQPGRIVLPSLITLVVASALLAGPAVTAGASAAGQGPLPVLYNLGGGTTAVWNLPQVRPRKFLRFADGSAALIGMRWARW